jgi:uncharacterized protein YecE (DUF72 family)
VNSCASPAQTIPAVAERGAPFAWCSASNPQDPAVADIRIGISGWRYPPWRGVFYPDDLPQRAELEYAASIFRVIEINGSFYSLQTPSSYAQWRAATPDGFVFTIKGPRYLTHIRRLRDIDTPLANFLASGLFNLGEKLGPILWQFPANFPFDPERMGPFLAMLPKDTDAALRLARRRSAWMKGRTRLAVTAPGPMRHAIEIRHDSFLDRAFVDLLRQHNVAWVVAETARRWPMAHDITADFVYMRLHGDKTLYQSGYGEAALDRWAARIRAWHEGGEPADAQKVTDLKPPGRTRRDVYCFFDNTDVKLRAPFDAQRLMAKLGVASPATGRVPLRSRSAPPRARRGAAASS